jgi:hypothetical protein
MTRFKRAVLVLVLAAGMTLSYADEGMWIPMLLGEFNEEEMIAMGMRITAEDIYSVNHSSLKDAVVIFGGGCTAEIVSDQGLILTNHHCGYGAIQRHSSIEHDYLTDGFWAFSHTEELPCPGLTCTLLIRMEDVSVRVLEGVWDGMPEPERQKLVGEHIQQIEKEAVEGTHYEASVEPFFYGNSYYLFITEVFRDIRLVGAPPSNIGKFGGDTDNWMWPRHTGDFSVFRIYVGPDNKPAIYSEENIPYTPRSHMTISVKGYEKGDFTFVFGYPGQTTEYLPSDAIDLITRVDNPIRIGLRDQALKLIGTAMQQDDKVRIQYAAKQAGIANSWKKWIGENRGIERLDAIRKKEEFEQRFIQWAEADPARKAAYGTLLTGFENKYQLLTPLTSAETWLIESAFRAEILRFASTFRTLLGLCQAGDPDMEAIQQEVEGLKSSAAGFFRNYNPGVDRQIFENLFRMYYTQLDPSYEPPVFNEIRSKYNGDISRYTGDLFSGSIFDSEEEVMALLNQFKPSRYKVILKDPAYRLVTGLRDYYFARLVPSMMVIEAEIDSMMRIYVMAQMEMEPGEKFYPDANSTLRVTYGTISDYYPADAVHYEYFTTLSGILEKEDPAIYDYVVDEKLKDLALKKDFGPYADKDGSMHVCFIASNHTSGGNSGSPVLNADGQLIGINFDRNWEGTMSDLMYDPSMCRNISLDIRYCLFIIDKFAGASHLIDEMTIVR